MKEKIKQHYKDATYKTMSWNKMRVWSFSFVLSVLLAALLLIFVSFVFTATASAEDNPQPSRARMSASPAEGKIPLDVTLMIRADSALLCTAYSIDWGDKSDPISYTPPSFNENCEGGPFYRTFTHTYKKVGVYKIQARAGNKDLADLATMKLYISAVDSDNATTTALNDDTLCFVNPKKGFNPLVTGAYVPLGGEKCDGKYEYFVDWGDGWRTPTSTCSQKTEHYDTFYHKYATSSDYTAKLYRFYKSEKIGEEECQVSVWDRPEIKFKIPNWHARAVIGKPLHLEWEISHTPPKLKGIDPTVRLTFLTKDNKRGFIADLKTSTTTYEWIPTTDTCPDDQICQSSIVPGFYKLQASIIYDICGGDPFCGKNVPTLSEDTTKYDIKVTTRGEPGESWMIPIEDKLFAYPQTSKHTPAIVNFTTVLNSRASCGGGVYTVDFGDDETINITYPRGKCESFASSFSHTYSSPGIYTVKLNKNGIEEASLFVNVENRPKTSGIFNRGFAAVFSVIKKLFGL